MKNQDEVAPQRGAEYGVRHLRVASVTVLVDFLIEACGESVDRCHELMRLGSVYVNEKRVLNPEFSLKAGDSVRCHTQPRRYTCPPDLATRIVFESEHVLVIDKPAGFPVHALVDNARENLLAFLQDQRGGNLYITHRLDIDTRGLLLVAKSKDAQVEINRLIANKSLRRWYRAWVSEYVKPGRYLHYMQPSPRSPKLVEREERAGWLKCDLEIISCRSAVAQDLCSLFGPLRSTELAVQPIFELQIELGTGRTQQIRAQLAALQAPLLGDWRYGSRVRFDNPLGPIALIASELRVAGRTSLLQFESLSLQRL